MKIIQLTAVVAMSGLACSCGQGTRQGWTVTLTNTTQTDLTQKAVTIKRADFNKQQDFYPLLLDAQGDTIPSQVDDVSADGIWDELFFLVDLPASGEAELTIKPINDRVDYAPQTATRFGKRDGATDPVEPRRVDTLYANQLPLSIGYQPYQTDGPSWENDKVGFRHYLDGRNAKDVFGKKVSYMSPADVGINAQGAIEDNYHVMLDWGRDILPVGGSVGIGGIALAHGNEVYRLGVTVTDATNNVDTTIFRVVREGPLRSKLNIRYRHWKAGENWYNVDEQPAIWPGMFGYQNTVSLEGLQAQDTLLIGLVNIFSSQPPQEINIDDKWVVLYTHDRQTYEQEWWLGLGLILPYDSYRGYRDAPNSGSLTNSYLAKLAVADNQPTSYYAVAGWELSDEGFRDRDYFENYVVDLARQLAAEVHVNIIASDN